MVIPCNLFKLIPPANELLIFAGNITFWDFNGLLSALSWKRIEATERIGSRRNGIILQWKMWRKSHKIKHAINQKEMKKAHSFWDANTETRIM